MTPHPFFAGFVVGLVLLGLAGRVVSSRPYIANFVRLHRYIDPDSLYYPTASQITTLAESATDGGKIAVIIGGDSVMRGVGQGASELWSEALQQDLGDRFVVVNLAMDAGSPTEYGAIAAQALYAQGRPMIYVTDITPGGLGDPDGDQFKYVYWDAYFKGLIPDYPSRDDLIRELAEAEHTESLVTEAQMRGRIESWLYATDLWNWIGYMYVFTAPSTYVQLPDAWPTTPRRLLDDPAGPDQPLAPAEVRYQAGTLDVELGIMKLFIPHVCTQGEDGLWREDPSKKSLRGFAVTGLDAFPEAVRNRSILLIESESPYYLKQFSRDELSCYNLSRQVASDNATPLGYNTLIFGDTGFTEDDYNDRDHLVATGGRKLAALLAPKIEQLAHQLNYD